MLESFPTSEQQARSVGTTDWNKTLFLSHNKDGKVYVTVPKNIETFMENLLMISILKLFEYKNWIPVLSETELPSAVLETKDGAFFAGFVGAADLLETGPMNTGTSKYSKGAKAYQLYCVQKAFGKSTHLRTGGMDKLRGILTEMKGFTKNYWSFRQTIINLFNEIPVARVTHLETYMKSKADIMKGIKTKLAYDNGGVYRPEEIAYLNDYFRTEKRQLEEFLLLLDHPSRDLAENWQQRYGVVATALKRVDEACRATGAARARVLFPSDKRRATLQFLKLSLTEKIQTFAPERKALFAPETLPGISAVGDARPQDAIGSHAWIQGMYPDIQQDTGVAVLSTWYRTFHQPEEAD